MLLKNAPKIFLLIAGCFTALLSIAQQQANIQVTGTVKNQQGEPLQSVSVQVVAASIGTQTNAEGKFVLTAPANGNLRFTIVGYDTIVQPVKSTMSIRLTATSAVLSDVVIIGYGTQKRKEVTGSIATVTAKDFQQGNIVSPEQLIAGKIAGVSITSNGGSPGAGSVIRIRGGASLNASNDPLIVIDGVPLSGNNIYGASNPLSLINPNDIASFTVLKDAASTAIYGSRASNGVILITTKKGASGKPVFNFSTVFSVSTLARKADVLTGDEFRKYVDSLGNGTFDNVRTYKSLMGTANTDWQDEIYQKALSTDNNISAAGAYKNIPYRFSFGYLNQDGLLRTDNLQRFSGGISLSPKFFTNHLKVDINLKGTASKARFANGAAVSSAVYFDPTQSVHAASPYGNYYEWASIDANNNSTLNKLAPRNPVALLDLYNNSSDVQRSYGNVQFDYMFHFLPELHANLNLGYDVASGKGIINVPAYAAQNLLDTGQQNKYGNKIGNKVAEFYLNYTKDLKSIKSNINVTAGYGYYNNLSTNYNYPFVRANGNIAPGTTPKYNMDQPENTLLSYYGRLIYTLNSKYVLAASIRTDASSKFSPSTRWGTYPSLAFTWRINRENFLQHANTLSDLKLRLSYGVTGNQDGIANYPYLSVYSLGDSSSQVQFGDTYYSMGTPSAYDLGIKWEQTAAYNVGLDYGFLKDRITGSVDFYFKKTKDLLNISPVPLGSNFAPTLLTNVGNIENKGVEFQVNAGIVKTKRFAWDASLNMSYNESKITNLTAVKDTASPGTLAGNGVIQIQTVGYNLNSFYVYRQQYLNGKPVEGVYADLNGDGVINQSDLYRYKSPFPKYTVGFSTQFTFDKWSLSTVLRANVGNYMYNGLGTAAVKSNVLNPLGYISNTLSEVTNSYFNNYNAQSDYYVQNASFLKMDNIGIGYNAGAVLNNKANLRLSINCQNVFTITKYTGIDPEIFGGIDNALYPRPRIYALGVNVQF